MATSRWRGGRSVTSLSPMRIRPCVASSRPAMRRSSVVLPQPEAPTSTMNSPSSIVRLSSRTALKPFGKTLLTPSTTIPDTGSPTIPLEDRSEKIGIDHRAADPYTRRNLNDAAGTHSPESLDELITEAGGAAETHYDLRPTVELVELMSANEGVSRAVRGARRAIREAIAAVVERLAGDGRLVYVGAGTSGGLAALDAEECETTFSTAPGQVVAITAKDTAAEDDREAGAAEVRELGVSGADAAVGLSASGRTPYVLGALEAANDARAFTVALVCSEGAELGRLPASEDD